MSSPLQAQEGPFVPTVQAGEVAGHTPGPWKACGTIYEHMNCEVRSGAKGEGQGIAQVWDGPNAFKDGLLMAAAPCLLEAAREGLIMAEAAVEARRTTIEERGDYEPDDAMLAVYVARRDMIRAAIAKATGEPR